MRQSEKGAVHFIPSVEESDEQGRLLLEVGKFQKKAAAENQERRTLAGIRPLSADESECLLPFGTGSKCV